MKKFKSLFKVFLTIVLMVLCGFTAKADVVVITTSLRSVYGNGHMSVITQDSVGEWFYFYWGDCNAYLEHVPKECMKNIDSFNTWLQKEIKVLSHMSTSNSYYKFGTYIKGNFTQSLEYYRKCSENYNTWKFWTYFNNCACQSFAGLKLGVLSNRKLFSENLKPRCQDYIPVWNTRPHTLRKMIERSFSDNTEWGIITNPPIRL